MEKKPMRRGPLRRLRSKSFEGGENSTSVNSSSKDKSAQNGPPRKCSKNFLPPLETPPPPVLLNTDSILFWRAKKTCEVFVYLHGTAQLFEVITIDRSSQSAKELNRLYIPQHVIENIVRGTHYINLVKSQRRDLVDRAIQKECIDYIMQTIDSSETETDDLHHNKKENDRSTIIRLQRFDAKRNISIDLTIPKPKTIQPAVLCPDLIPPVATPEEASAIQADLESNITNIARLTNAARHSLAPWDDNEEVLKYLEKLHGPNEKSYATGNTTNPNMYSAKRWNWIWTINQIIHRNRLTKILREMTMLRNKKRMIAGMSVAEYDRRRQISILRVQGKARCRTTLRELMDMGKNVVCPLYAKQPDFRKYALKNVMMKGVHTPVFKVSINEIYETTRVKPVSFGPHKGNSIYGRKRLDEPQKPTPRPKYKSIHEAISE